MCAVVLDRDRLRHERAHVARRALRRSIAELRVQHAERCVDDARRVREPPEERRVVEPAPVLRRRDDHGRALQLDAGGDRRVARPCELAEHVRRRCSRPHHGSDVDARRNDEREIGARAERPRSGRGRVDRDEPPARHPIGAAPVADRHDTIPPARQVALDLRAAVARDVEPEDVHAGLRRAAELQAACDGGTAGGDQDDDDEDDPPLHRHSEATRGDDCRNRLKRTGDGVSVAYLASTELRDLPSVDELARGSDDPLAVDAARAVPDRAREEIRAGTNPGDLAERLETELARARRPALRRVLNATGVIVHTNLGRAPLPEAALARVAEVGRGYSNLEYDLADGARGSRQDHVASILRRLTGAESAIVVNNNAGAMLLALAALAEGREVLVSRGELIEIGDGFRIPDVLARSGAKLVEIATRTAHEPGTTSAQSAARPRSCCASTSRTS